MLKRPNVEKPCVLMRASLAEDEELQVAKKHFQVHESRSSLPSESLVIGRYSCLPYYSELETDLAYNGSYLINTFSEHKYVADIQQWYNDLQNLTPKTWFTLEDFKKDSQKTPGKSYVLKGETNSKKQQWNTHMFAPSENDVSLVYSRLSDDGFLGDQNIYIREYVPLRQFGTGLRGLPITEEYRFFVLDETVVGSGYYWSQFPEAQEENNLVPGNVPQEFLSKVLKAIGNKIRFYVVDIAHTQSGEWIVIELNDGQMSGLSEVDPDSLYENMSRQLGYVR